jgi:large subunit ribosomal protein L31
MNKKIQPKVYTNCVVTCACGNTFITTSTEEKITVDICSACHPFYTGKQKFIDTEGRIEKFQKKMNLAKGGVSAKKTKKAKISGDGQTSAEKRKTLKEMLEEAQKVQG